MGGRGGAAGTLAKADGLQRKAMNRLIQYSKEDENRSKPTFKFNKDGTISFSFTQKRVVVDSHPSNSDKDVLYERTTLRSGRLLKDSGSAGKKMGIIFETTTRANPDVRLGTRKQLRTKNN